MNPLTQHLRGPKRRGMALVDPAFGRMSGKVGGLVFGTNKGGAYVRALVNPTNPNTPFQQAIRSATSQLTARWVGTLTQVQRDSWETYAANVTVPNRWGNPIHISGLAMYIRSCVSPVQFFGAAAIKDDAPVIFNLGEYSEPTGTLASAATVSVAFNAADDWVSEDGAAMLFYASRNQNASKVFWKGPYRPCTSAILGSSGAPPASPVVLTLPFPAVMANKTFFFARVMRNDARLSAEWRGFDLGAWV